MGHYCGAPNRSVGGTCGRWLVNYDHCADHRREEWSFSDYPSREPQSDDKDHAAELLADVLTDGVDEALANLIVDYVGKVEVKRLRRRRRHSKDCQWLAEAAKAISDLGERTHRVTGRMVSDALPHGTARFVRRLVAKMGEKIPLPWDAKIKLVVHGLQAVGIFLCMIQGLAPQQCPCLLMLARDIVGDAVKEKISKFVEGARRELTVEIPQAA